MAEQPEPAQQESVDINRVLNSYQRQIAEQAHQIAVKDALIEMLQEERMKLKQMIDELSITMPKISTSPTAKGKKK